MGKGEGSGGVNTSDERASATTSFGTSSLKKANKSGGRSGKSVTINTAVKYGGYGIGVRTPDEFKVSDIISTDRDIYIYIYAHSEPHIYSCAP